MCSQRAIRAHSERLVERVRPVAAGRELTPAADSIRAGVARRRHRLRAHPRHHTDLSAPSDIGQAGLRSSAAERPVATVASPGAKSRQGLRKTYWRRSVRIVVSEHEMRALAGREGLRLAAREPNSAVVGIDGAERPIQAVFGVSVPTAAFLVPREWLEAVDVEKDMPVAPHDVVMTLAQHLSRSFSFKAATVQLSADSHQLPRRSNHSVGSSQ